MMFCGKCGNQVADGAAFCPNCGATTGKSEVNMETNNLQANHPEQNQWPHMTMKDWVITYLLLLIPIANIVFMFVWAFGNNVNPSKKSFCRVSLIVWAIGVILTVISFGSIMSALVSMYYMY